MFLKCEKTFFKKAKKTAALSKLSIDEAITNSFDSYLLNKEGEGPQWLKPFCFEFMLTTILDAKPGVETDDEWDEDSFVESVNGALDQNKLQVVFDPDYNWEDTTGSEPLTVSLETLDEKPIGSTKYTFPDPEEFDQADLMTPINELLASKGLRFLDASWLDSDTIQYNWILFPAKEGDRLEKKYGSLTEWWQHFPQREEDEEGEEGEEGNVEEAEEDYEEPEPPKKKVSPPQQKQMEAGKRQPEPFKKQQEPPKRQQEPPKRNK